MPKKQKKNITSHKSAEREQKHLILKFNYIQIPQKPKHAFSNIVCNIYITINDHQEILVSLNVLCYEKCLLLPS